MTSGYVADFYQPREYKFMLRIGQPTKVNPFVVRPVTVRKSVGGIAIERVWVEGHSGRLRRGCVMFSVCRSKQCQN